MKRDRRVLGDRRAFVTVYMAFAMLTLIPMVGLAIDFSILYNVKARLQQACDAGAIGAGSEVQRSTDVNNAATNASLRATVLRFFNANFLPAPWNATQVSYTSTITQDTTTKVRTIYVTATYGVPMMFLRVLGVKNSQVAAQAIADLRFVNMILVVDRSGSVQRTGSGTETNQEIIQDDLTQFVGTAGTSIFVDGRDIVGMVTFGGNYYVDFQPTASFQTASPNINTAIGNIFFGTNNSTNTGEGLYQAWYQLTQLNQTGALNVIVLITDGRPSAFTGTFSVSSTSSCTPKGTRAGFIDNPVGLPFPPTGTDTANGVLLVYPPCNLGYYPPLASQAGCESSTLVDPTGTCSYVSDTTKVYKDIPTFPATIGPLDHLNGPYATTFSSTSGFFPTSGYNTNVSSAKSVRYAAYAYAANVAKAIRTDTTYNPVIYCVGLNFDTTKYSSEEPLDADFLASLANDPGYRTTGTSDSVYPTAGQSVYVSGQTTGKYYNVSYSGLGAALQDITTQILRLAAH